MLCVVHEDDVLFPFYNRVKSLFGYMDLEPI